MKDKRFAYSSAKICSLKQSCYTKNNFKRYLKFEYSQILLELSNNFLKGHISKNYMKFEGFYLIEKILNEKIFEVYQKVFLSIPKKNKVLFEDFYQKYEIKNFISILELRKLNDKNFESFLVGDLKERRFYLNLQNNSTDEILKKLSKRLKIDFKKVNELYKKSFYEFQNFLYVCYYKKLYNSFKQNFKGKNILNFLKNEIDLVNLKTYYLLLEEKSLQNFDDLFIYGGSFKNSYFKRKLTYEVMKKDLLNSINFSKKLNFDKGKNLQLDEIEEMIKLNIIYKFKKVKFGEIDFIFNFLFDFENQIKTLRNILKAKFMGLSKNEILQIIREEI